ncbi:hypothetical protein TCAL_02496 [Tigriopus californicus]|uniref:Nardilysin n=2 Tax=Tigriopus californicus TaxID=6832 RepID=A0A553NTJ7_TIGCA|nr:nardilysin-like isoform X1 [Tigriopus californicus]TRY68749.1 hypothetical protein TCAL_02496 [Tigriopus californicus]
MADQPPPGLISVQVLATPAKSKSDPKEYRTLQLDNGLRVLLIADTAYPLDQLDRQEEAMSQMDSDQEDDDENEEEDEDDDDDEEEEEESEDEGMDLDEDDRRGKASKSLSGLKLSAAGLCVGMGSFSDPESLPGLAHFLEHMVFMGSKKYPDENSFDEFVSKHGGSDNASTDCETTVFYFECQRKSFREALDRFAQFFIDPLMKPGAMARERESVDSEFEMALPSDYNRKQQIFGSLAKPGHPMGKFMWGNTKSLQSSGKDDKAMHKLLHEFKNRHYTAQFMTLVVQAQQELDTLQEWVVESFSNVPNNKLERETFGHMTEPFDTPSFHRLYKVAPVQNIYQIDLNWALKSMLKEYKVKPLHYLSWVIGHEGRGSLISYLRKKIWALGLTSGNAGDGFEHNSTYSIFSISIVLTKEGFAHLSEVTRAVWAYIDMMQKKGPKERIYKEIQRIEELDFQYGEERQPSDNVETLCENMQLFPPELYLTGDDLMFEFNENSIRECLDALQKDRVNIFVTAKEYEDGCNQVEEWFKTKYSVEDVPKDWKSAWNGDLSDIQKSLHLPEKNQFIAENLSLKALPSGTVPRFPIQIKKESNGELFFRPDDHFKQPRAHLHFMLVSPLPLESARNSALLDLMMALTAQSMVEDTYAADLAQLQFQIYGSERGVVLKAFGLNDKLKLVLSEILKHLVEFGESVDPEFFEAVKAQTKKSYYNAFIKPMKLVKDVRMSILQDQFHGAMDRHAVVSELKLDEVRDFAQKFRSEIFIHGLVQGNLTEVEALEIYDLVKGKMKAKPISNGTIPELRCRALPTGKKIVRVAGLNPLDGNTGVTNYYQFAPGNLKSHALLELANTIMEEPVFDRLRTQEQLGYQTFSMLRNTFGVLGLSITICSQASKFSAEHVDSRIEAFMEWFLNERLAKMDQQEFDEVRETLVKLKKTADVTLKEEVDRNWSEICSREYLFDRCGQEIEILEQCTKQEVTEIVKRIFKDDQKLLSVQVVGNENAQDELCEEATKVIDIDQPFEWNYLETNDKFIGDIPEFRSTLLLHPVIRIIK